MVFMIKNKEMHLTSEFEIQWNLVVSKSKGTMILLFNSRVSELSEKNSYEIYYKLIRFFTSRKL